MLKIIGTVFLGSLATHDILSNDPTTSLILSLSSLGSLCGSYLINKPHPYLLYSSALLCPVAYRAFRALDDSKPHPKSSEPSSLDDSTYEHVELPDKSPSDDTSNSNSQPCRSITPYLSISAFVLVLIGYLGEFKS
ncbi:hypothetical protein TRICI_001731 [Trichomonascus ciferrii]|uniref:Uncharacterized protein n=1 Tax=Trichomonascus ciferrii TaxID=44093 RepID=A0A642V7K9_9ASCO|nr:hypothetical protein TRICI_001731 [Trichomonascus ciferrii]